MSIFSLGRKPRAFHHVPIFYDERQDRLKEIEDRARRTVKAAQGDSGDKGHEMRSEDLRGAFSEMTTHVRRRKERGAHAWSNNIGMLLIIIVVLLVVWYYIIRY